jgi:hypothetical protein
MLLFIYTRSEEIGQSISGCDGSKAMDSGGDSDDDFAPPPVRGRKPVASAVTGPTGGGRAASHAARPLANILIPCAVTGGLCHRPSVA